VKRSASTARTSISGGRGEGQGSKFGKSRELPLHPTTVTALRVYLRIRDAHSTRT
jgi:integrase